MRSLHVLVIVALVTAASAQSAAPNRPAPAPAASGIHSVYGDVPAPAPAPPAAAPDTGPQPTVGTVSTSPDMRIGGGDLLEVSVYGAPDYDKLQVRVSGTGDIALPLIGVQHVGGMNVAQAQQLVAQKLSEGQFFSDPQVSIFIREYATQGISVLGEVQKPGVYPVLGSRRLFDAVSMAGGLTPRAGKVVSITRRENPDHPQTIALGSDLQGSTQGNVEVMPGDTVVVSKAGIVYVVGDVRLPGGFVMENGRMTVLQALAMAQGANPTASLNGARLIRAIDGKQEESPIPLKQILSAKKEDLSLKPDDILFVPSSATKSATRRSVDAIVQTVTGLAIYGRL